MRRSPDLRLRAAGTEDAPALARLAADAFVAAFGPLYRPEDLARFLAEERSVERFQAQLADPAVRAQLAEIDGRPAGYALIMLGKQFAEEPEPPPRRPVLLSQLYCDGGFAGRGIGAALMAWVLDEARDWRAESVTLSVFSGNPGAQRFYRRHGFAHVADTQFWVGEQCDREFVYTLQLGDPGVHPTADPA